MNTFSLTISTPGGKQFEGEVECLALRGAEGDLAVLAGHVPLMTTVQAGPCRVTLPGGTVREAACAGGLLTVGAEGTIVLLEHFSWIQGD